MWQGFGGRACGRLPIGPTAPERRTEPWDCFGKETREYFLNDFLGTFTCQVSRHDPKEPRRPEVSKDGYSLSTGRRSQQQEQSPRVMVLHQQAGTSRWVTNVGNHYRCQE